MIELIRQLGELARDAGGIVLTLFSLLVPWTGWILWALYWSFLVDWRRFWPLVRRGGAISVACLAGLAAALFLLLSPQTAVREDLFGLSLSPAATLVVGTGLAVIVALWCGTAQLARLRFASADILPLRPTRDPQ